MQMKYPSIFYTRRFPEEAGDLLVRGENKGDLEHCCSLVPYSCPKV